jgi:hypothetical protein
MVLLCCIIGGKNKLMFSKQLANWRAKESDRTFQSLDRKDMSVYFQLESVSLTGCFTLAL